MQNQNNDGELTGGWIANYGYTVVPPFAEYLRPNQHVEVEFRDSTRNEFHRDVAYSLVWKHSGSRHDIVSYRVREESVSIIDHDRAQETEVETLKRQMGAVLDDKEYLKGQLLAANSKRLFHFQDRVISWVVDCFGSEVADCRPERNHRFLEEALELVQALGCTRDESHQLVDYVFDRPVGSAGQEVGGVMITLAALCGANELSMGYEAEVELGRICAPEIKEKIRLKQAAKPAMSPLPEYPEREPYKIVASTIDSYVKKIEQLERDNESLREHNQSMQMRLRCDHPDDRAVNAFADALKVKMAASRAKGRGGWDKPDECAISLLAELLIDEVSAKGDPLDIGAYAMMLHQRGASSKDVLEQAIGRIDTVDDLRDWPLAVKSYMDSVPCIPKFAFDPKDPNLTMFNVGECLRKYSKQIEHETRNFDTAVNYVKFLHVNGLGTTFSTFIDQFKYDKQGAEIAFKFCEDFMSAVNFLLLTLTGNQLYISREDLLPSMCGSLGLSRTIADYKVQAYPPSREPRMQRQDMPRSPGRRKDDTDSERKCYLQSPAVIPEFPFVDQDIKEWN